MATANRLGTSILSDRQTAKRAEVIELLTRAYWMEMETVIDIHMGVDENVQEHVCRLLHEKKQNKWI